ncbi:MAG: hypothetical protein K6G12_10670 [Lachnospiraceae bacterium]|nr:hypothetical protein [Lachnospiraceae bacterium]
MSLFSKKEKITLYSETQKDEFIDKLERAHVTYNLHEDKDSVFSNSTTYIVKLNASDLKKVI